MSRELKRVPMDFRWPLSMPWRGYICPYRSQPCKPCDGSGRGAAMKQLADDFYDFAGTGRRWCDQITDDEVAALLTEQRLMRFPEPITAQRVNDAERQHHVHDAINRWILIRIRAERLHVAGSCEYCAGEGEHWFTDEVKRLYDKWERYDPPTGAGFQLWENVSEGSPVSPVFSSLDELCVWCETHATTFGSERATAAEWREMLAADFVHASDDRGNIFM